MSPGLAFACALGLLLAATAALWAARPEAGRVQNITRAERPSDDYYLAHDRAGHLDHHVLYFGTDAGALEALRGADVLLLGNSRLMFAARPVVLDPFFAARGLSYYLLGFGFREADRFPQTVMEKFDLRPKVVVVNADGFFLDSLSEFGESVMRDSAFDAWKFVHESETSHDVRRVLHQLVPNWLDLFGRPGFPWRRELIIYRSRTTGAWQLSPWEPGTAPVPLRDLDTPPTSSAELATARRFKDFLEARGATLVLTYVPTPRPLSGGPAALARALGVPLVAVHPPGLRTEDLDHLDEPSGAAWSEAFVRQVARYLP